MTIAIGFRCSDGVVVGADSMLTPTIGGLHVGHHTGVKVEVLPGEQVFAFAGDLGQAFRFRQLCEGGADALGQVSLPIEYPLSLTASIIEQFRLTGIRDAIDVSTLLGFVHGDEPHLCVFEQGLQPRILDENHYHVALGSGKLSADPFLRFLVDIFCKDGRPSVAEAVWLTTWIIGHACDTTPGGVARPTRISVIEATESGDWTARSLDDYAIEEHEVAIADAKEALADWRRSFARRSEGEEESSAPPIPQMLAGPGSQLPEG